MIVSTGPAPGGGAVRSSQPSDSALGGAGVGPGDGVSNRLLNASFAFGPNKDAAMLSRVRQKRKGDTHTTLFVNTGGGEPAPSHRHISPALKDGKLERGLNRGVSNGPSQTDASGGEDGTPDWNASLENITGALGGIPETLSKCFRMLRQTMLLAVFVLLILLSCQAILLWVNLSVLSTTLQIQTYKNSQHVQIASHLTLQMNDMERALIKLEDEIRTTGGNASETEAYQEMLFELRGMDVARRQSLVVLREGLGYRGPVSDTEFLIDQHVEFESHVQQLAREEIAWIGIITRNEHHQLHRRMERSLSSHHPLFKVSHSAFQLAQKWMRNFYGDEQRIRRYWEVGEAERRRVVSDLSAQLASSFDVVRMTSPSAWRWLWGWNHPGENRENPPGSSGEDGGGHFFSRFSLPVLLLALIGLFFWI